jgi:hypothetical protein
VYSGVAAWSSPGVLAPRTPATRGAWRSAVRRPVRRCATVSRLRYSLIALRASALPRTYTAWTSIRVHKPIWFLDTFLMVSKVTRIYQTRFRTVGHFLNVLIYYIDCFLLTLSGQFRKSSFSFYPYRWKKKTKMGASDYYNIIIQSLPKILFLVLAQYI